MGYPDIPISQIARSSQICQTLPDLPDFLWRRLLPLGGGQICQICQICQNFTDCQICQICQNFSDCQICQICQICQNFTYCQICQICQILTELPDLPDFARFARFSLEETAPPRRRLRPVNP